MIAAGESDSVEFKAKWNERALEDLAAFANHKGGTLFVGVTDNGSVCGFSPTDKELQVIANQITDVLGVRPSIRTVKHGARSVLEVGVKPAVTSVSCRGRYLTRVGSVNREMSPEDIGHNLMEKLGETWDALPSALTLADVDPAAVREFVTLAKPRLRGAKLSDPPRRVLENLKLLRNGKLTKGGALLFAKDPQRAVVSGQTHIGRFKSGTIEDDRMVEGNLWQQLDAAMEAFRTYLQKRVEVKVTELTLKGLQNIQTWEYPLDALREAVINALIHRDYAALGNVEVRVYEDSILVRSPGGLPKQITVAQLREPKHSSFPRNPLLARAFFLAGHIEQWGTGTTKIIHLCRAQGLPDPVFEDEGGSVLVTFQKDVLTPERLKSLGLNERQRKAVLHLKEHGGDIGNKEYQEITGAPKRTASMDLTDLAERGILERTGSAGRGVRYRARMGQMGQASGKKRATKVRGRRRGP